MANTTKFNKSAWIREQPATASAADVVATAKKQGIVLSPAQVYTTRSLAAKGTAKPKAPQPAAAPSVAKSDMPSTDKRFRQLALAIGIRRAESVIKDLKALANA